MKKNYRPAGADDDRSKKRYIERLIEDKEAEEQIKEYKKEERLDDDEQEQIQNNLR